MVIPYQTVKFKSVNIFTMAIYGPTAKFNSCQYFQLYGIKSVLNHDLLITLSERVTVGIDCNMCFASVWGIVTKSSHS